MAELVNGALVTEKKEKYVAFAISDVAHYKSLHFVYYSFSTPRLA